jgi:hypothetical protein
VTRHGSPPRGHRLWACALCLAAAVVWAQPGGQTFGILLDQVVAEVDGQVITRSRIDAEARVILVRRGGVAALSRSVDDELRASVLEYLINQLVIEAEAERLRVFQVSDAEVSKEAERFRSLFEEPADFQHFLRAAGLSEDELTAILARNLRVDRYLSGKVQLDIEVTEEEIRGFYRENQARLGRRPLDEIREAVRSFLVRQEYEQRVAEWVSGLRARAVVRIVSPFEGATAAPSPDSVPYPAPAPPRSP